MDLEDGQDHVRVLVPVGGRDDYERSHTFAMPAAEERQRQRGGGVASRQLDAVSTAHTARRSAWGP